LSKLPNLTRWFTALVSLKESQEVLGSFKFCTKPLEPILIKKEEKKEEKKEKQPKKKEEKKEEKKDDNKKSEKEEKERLRMEKIEAEKKVYDDSVKAWLEAPCKLDFEEFKRT